MRNIFNLIKGYFVPQESDLSNLLLSIVNGDPTLAEAMVKQKPSLLLSTGTIKDHKERKYENLTAFQLALVLLDCPMWNMLLKYMQTEDIIPQLKALQQSAKAQALMAENQQYVQDLIDSLELVCDPEVYQEIHPDNPTTISEIWIQTVADSQRRCCVHILQMYSRPDLNFQQILEQPDLLEQPMPLPRVDLIKQNDWKDLGSTYGLLRGNKTCVVHVGNNDNDYDYTRFRDVTLANAIIDMNALTLILKHALRQRQQLCDQYLKTPDNRGQATASKAKPC
jgi:hypothetical protein